MREWGLPVIVRQNMNQCHLNGEARINAHDVFDHPFCYHLTKAGTKNFVDGFTGREVDVLDYICAVYEGRVCIPRSQAYQLYNKGE